MTPTPELRALYQLHRYQILLCPKGVDGKYVLPEPYLYAVAHDVYPMWHQSWHTDDNDPFESMYHTKKEFIEDLMTYVDGLWVEKKSIPTFYDLERKYGQENRSALIRSFRYCYLNRGFDESFYRQLLGTADHPTEASGICHPFEEYELSLM